MNEGKNEVWIFGKFSFYYSRINRILNFIVFSYMKEIWEVFGNY